MPPEHSQDIEQLLSGLHPLEKKVLAVLKLTPSLWDEALIRETGLDESRLSMALGWLLTKTLVKMEEEKKTRFISITDLGKKYAKDGLPEARIVKRLEADESVSVRDLASLEDMEGPEVSTVIGNLKAFEIARVGQGGRLEYHKKEIPSLIKSTLTSLLNELKNNKEPKLFESLSPEEANLLNDFLDKKWKTRGVIKFREKKSRRIVLSELGRQLLPMLSALSDDEDEVSQLTPEMLKEGSWKGKSFRKFNIGLNPSRAAPGRKHSYRAFLDHVKTKLVSMGFEEMRGPLVESEFWNSDALFMPQFHPARDIHDVYFVDQPRALASLPKPFDVRVAAAHENGWKTGSRGWRYSFDKEQAKRLVLRSQGTSVSARHMAGSPKIPGKYFSIARCFRYDLVDATHAPDFFQVEGIALGEKMTFRTLLGLLKLFATEMAHATEVKYLPAYFPYTEPSVEMHVRHPKLGWMELGGAGLFRPEVTRPLGVDVPVIAWGLGLDRMAMVALGIEDIRDLFTADLDMIRTKKGRA